MKVGIFTREKKLHEGEDAEKLLRRMKEKGIEAVVVTEDEAKSVDVLVVLGGDGTILRAVAAIGNSPVKIIGVNYGTVGFLTEFEPDEEDELIDFLKKAEKGFENVLKRTLLEITLNGQTFYALNEAAFQRDYADPSFGIMQTDVCVNGNGKLSFKGDGALVCTPTGSTAYALSAGGAILDPFAPVTMLTPVCSYSLNARSVVLPDSSEIELSVSRACAAVLADGRLIGKMSDGDVAVVKKASFRAEFPVREGQEFFGKIAKKLK